MVWLPQLPKKQRTDTCTMLWMLADVGAGHTPVCAQWGQHGHIWAQLCSVFCHIGEDQINCPEIPSTKSANVVSRTTPRDSWSSTHSTSWQRSLEQGSALLTSLPLSVLWHSLNVLEHRQNYALHDFQTVFHDRCNSKEPKHLGVQLCFTELTPS